MIEQIKENIEFFIKNAKIDKAFLEFETYFYRNGDVEKLKDILIELKSKYKKLKNDLMYGYISDSDGNIERNKIVASLIQVKSKLGIAFVEPIVVINQTVQITNNLVINSVDLKNPKNLKEFLDRNTMPKTIAEFEEIVVFSNTILEFLKSKMTKSSDYSRATIDLVVAFENFEETKNTEKCFETAFTLKKEISKLEKTVNDFLELETQENITKNNHPIDDLVNEELMNKNLNEFFEEFEIYIKTLVSANDIEKYYKEYLERKIQFIEKSQGKREEVLKVVETVYKKLEKLKLKTYYDNYLK